MTPVKKKQPVGFSPKKIIENGIHMNARHGK
jgi:hypothetical protein